MSYLFSDYQQTRRNTKLVKYVPTTWQLNTSPAWTYVEGSRIYYTPESTDSRVIYEFYTAFSWEDVENQSDFKLQIGTTLGNITDVDPATSNQPYHLSHGGNGANYNTQLNDLVVLRYELDSWSGQKIIETHFKHRDARPYVCRLHYTRYAGTTTLQSLYNSFVLCYEID